MLPPKTPPMYLKFEIFITNSMPDTIHLHIKMLRPQLHGFVHQQLSSESKAVLLPVLRIVDSRSKFVKYIFIKMTKKISFKKIPYDFFNQVLRIRPLDRHSILDCLVSHPLV